MAKILFAARSNIIWAGDNAFDPYYEALLLELKKNNHDILVIRTNDIVGFDNESQHRGIDIIIKEKIIQFKPELIIAANNSLPDCIYPITSCPILLLMADTTSFFEGKEFIKKHIERYTFLHCGWDSCFYNDCIRLFNSKPEQNVNIGYHTAIQAQHLDIFYNISFVGTIGWGRSADKTFLHLQNNKQLEEFIQKFKFTNGELSQDTAILNVLTSNMRIKTLDALTDLGLNIFGWKNNMVLALPYSIELVKCFNFNPMLTLSDTQNMLNSSVISLTVPNAQAVNGLSWRVADILASNACLVSPPQKDLKTISPYIEIPTYTSPAEARDVCQRLLKDEAWRKDVVMASQKAVDEKNRFSHLLEYLQDISGITLCNTTNSDHAGKFELISAASIPNRFLLPKGVLQKMAYYSMRPRLFMKKFNEKFCKAD